jgi:hypothetical protein
MKPLPENAWDPWSPDELFARLDGSGLDWYIVGGWALDLWHARPTRTHEDLEFSVRCDQIGRCREMLSELEFFMAKDGKLSHLPSAAPLPADAWQQWGADMDAGCWRVDMMVDRGTSDLWVYKRDPSLSMPRAVALRKTASGISYLAPSLVLLFKAKHVREKDNQDFHTALPKLEPHEKANLRRWLERLHPGHQWLEALQASGRT